MRLGWFIAVLASACRSHDGGPQIPIADQRVAVADAHTELRDGPPTADALEFEAMRGPFPSLTAYCRDQEIEATRMGETHLDAGECPGLHKTLAAPFRSAAVLSFEQNSHYPLEYWHVAIQTAAGWFVAELPLCSGRGCTNKPKQIEVRRVAGGTPLIAFAFGHSESGRTASFSGNETGTSLIVCALGSADRPACTKTAIPIRVDANGADDQVTEGNMSVTLRLELRPAEVRGDQLALDIVATRDDVRGTILEANAWRERIAMLLGPHLLNVP